MTQRLRFILDGDDNLTRVLNHAGDASARLHRRLNDDMNGNSRATRAFTQDADGRLRDLRGRFISVADASRLMGNGMPDLTRRLGDVGNASGQTSSALGSSGGLGGTMLGVAAIAGVSLLPAIGALVPMLAGAALAAGTLKLGFAGVGGALEAQGKGQKEYAAALKKLPKPAQDFTKALVGVKKEFSGVGKEVQKAMLPGFTKAVQAAGPVVKILGGAMTSMGGAFGDAAEGVGRLLKDSGFQDSLQTNLKLGVGFIRDMTGALGPFIRSLLDFGAASGPTLKAFSDGIGGLLSKGLPGMFNGLKAGIPGAAKMLDGLFSAVNDILPALGRMAGEFGHTFGPLFGDTFKVGGVVIAGAMDLIRGAVVRLRPVFKDLTFGFQAVMDIGRIIGPTLVDVGGAIASAFAPIGDSATKAVGPLQKLDLWVKNNHVAVLEAARQFGVGMITMVDAAIQAAPQIIKAFRFISLAMLDVAGVSIAAAATAFGWVPGIGGKLKAANKAFNSFKDGYIGALDTAGRKADEFAASATPKLAAGKLKLNINNWQQQIDAAKAKMKTVPASKQAALKATITDLQNKVSSAKRQLNSLNGKTATTWIYTNVKTTYSTAGSVSGGKSVHGMVGATGGLYTGAGFRHRGYADGGLVDGPGSETSDSVYAPWLSKNEFVVNAARTRQYLPLLKAINTGKLALGSLAGSGGGTASAGMEAGRGLASGMRGALSLVDSAARTMAAAVTTGIRTELQIASPSKKTKALAADIGKGLIVGLTGTRDKIKSTAADLAKDIRTAFSGKKETGLVKMVDKQTKKLLDLQAKRDKVASTIAAAKEYASTTTTNARSAAGLSNLGMAPEEVTAGGIKAGLQQKLAQIKTFSSYVSQLAKRGLNKGLLRQILDMGPVDGYAYASALAGASKTTLSAINSTQKQIDSTTTSLGRTGADVLYDAGKNAGKGFLKGLEGQQADIEKLMTKIALGMQKSLRKALGIRSPARKLIPDGINTARGIAVGVLQGLPHIDAAMNAVAGRMTGNTPQSVGRPAVGGAGGGTVYNVQVDVHDAMDPIAVGRELQRVLVQFGRAQGTTVSLKVGG
jgi:chorismate mutase